MMQMYYDFLKQQKKKGKILKWAKKKMGLHVTTKKEETPYSMLHECDNR